ncbi:hypothetical protein JXJ21_08980 [candidate division KSB1 bacterium]|nr:hypothetical protein [candidate division KSB1 bacterium]
MFRSIIIIIMIFCFGLYTSCAPIITDINIKKTEYDSINNVKVIYVTTRNGKQYEFVLFSFTESHLIGKESFKGDITNTVKIKLSEITSLKIKGVRDDQGKIITKEEIEKNLTPNRRTGYALLGCAIGNPTGYLLSFPLCYIFLGGNKLGTNECIFIGLTSWIGGTALGSYLGYKGAKNAEVKKAVKKIEEERDKAIENARLNLLDSLKMKDNIIIISERVGEVIDQEEKARYHLFPDIKSFRSAILQKSADDNYVFKITYIDELTGDEKIKQVPQKKAQVKQIKKHIEKFE